MEARVAWVVERLRLGLLAVGLVCAGIVVLGGLLGKTTAWSGSIDGSGSGWVDGVKPWAVWAFVGGSVVIALLLVGWSQGDGLWVLAGAGAFLLWHAGNEAAVYRARIELGILTMYDGHRISLGLRVVPTVGMVGAIAAGMLAVMTLAVMMTRRVAPGEVG